jgi:hypothetical protein
MAKYEFLDVQDIESIRSFANIFSYTALMKWFKSLPDLSRQTPARAQIADPQTQDHFRVKYIDGYMRSTLGLYFTALASDSVERVSIIARQNQYQKPYRDIDLLSDKSLSWRRTGPSELELIPIGMYVRQAYEPTIVRVESHSPLDPLFAESAVTDIARLLRTVPEDASVARPA